MKKLLLALVVAAVMLVGLVVPALAVGPGKDGLGSCPEMRGGGPGDTHVYVPSAAGNANPTGAWLHPDVVVPPGH